MDDSIRTDAPNWQPWLIFFLKSLQQQKARLEKKIERERLILDDLPELSVQILELCRERGRVTVADAATVTGHIEKHGGGRGTWYSLA